MTLFSCATRRPVTIESTTIRVSTTLSISAASTIRRMSERRSATRTYSVRASSTLGGRRSTPMTASTSGSSSSACASRPPQKVDRPVMRMRREVTARSPEPDGASAAEHVHQLVLDAGAHLVGDRLHEALVLPRLVPEAVRGDRRQEADEELRRQVPEHAQQTEVRERRRDGEVEEAGQALQRGDLGEDRRGLLRPDHGDRDDRGTGAHRRLDETPAAEAAQAIAVLEELLRALAALGEDEHELLLVVEEAVDVGRVRGHGADLRQE